MTEITSRKNGEVLFALSLHEKRSRDAEGLFFTEGKKLYDEGILSGNIPEKVFVTNAFLSKYGEARGEKIFLVTPDVYSKITDEKAPEGIFAVFKKPKFESPQKAPIIILEDIQDPGNVGTILRTAVAFGVGEIVTVGSADVYSPKAVRSTMGAVFKIPVTAFSDIESAVCYARGKTDKVIAAALSKDSVLIDETDTSYAAVMIGNEGRGLSEKALSLADEKVIIPMINTESLNASVAASVFMYDSMMKRKKNG